MRLSQTRAKPDAISACLLQLVQVVSTGMLAPRSASARTVARVSPCTEPAPAQLGTMAPAVSTVRAALENSLGWGEAFFVVFEPPHVGNLSVNSAEQH